MRGILPQH